MTNDSDTTFAIAPKKFARDLKRLAMERQYKPIAKRCLLTFEKSSFMTIGWQAETCIEVEASAGFNRKINQGLNNGS